VLRSIDWTRITCAVTILCVSTLVPGNAGSRAAGVQSPEWHPGDGGRVQAQGHAPVRTVAELPDLPRNLFQLKWVKDFSTEMDFSPGGVSVALPRRRLALPSHEGITVLDLSTGKEVERFQVSEPIHHRNELGELPDCEILQKAGSPLLIVVQRHYDVMKAQGRSNVLSGYERSLDVKAFDTAGKAAWSLSFEHLADMAVDVVPAGGEQLVLVSGPSDALKTEFALYDSAGKLLLRDNLGASVGLMVTDADANGIAEFYLLSRFAAACYELKPGGARLTEEP
jgi:hypothetical protein